jgi:pimeloyl-ACP methyl ester carboxylesterase
MLALTCLSALVFGQGADFMGKTPPAWTVKEYLNVKGGKPPDTKGKVVLYEFWTTWCGVCKRAIPQMIHIDQTFRKKGLAFISITYEEKPAVEKFLKTSKITYPVALDCDQETFRAYGVKGVPTAYVLDLNGRVIWNGQPEALTDDQMEDLMKEGFRAGDLVQGEQLPPLAFEKTGEGPLPVVLLHGLGGSARDWDRIKGVWSRTMTLYTVDFYGHGRTPPLDRPTTLMDLARGVMQLMQKEKIEHPVILGHSMGGLVALQLAEINPGAFAALVIVDIPPCRKSVKPTAADRKAFADGADQFIREHWGRWATQPEDAEAVVKSALATDRKTFLDLYWDVQKADLRPGFGALRLPVLVVYAEPTGGFSAADDPQKLYDGVPAIQFSIISGVRHFIMLDDPRTFSVTVFNFLGKNLGKRQ